MKYDQRFFNEYVRKDEFDKYVEYIEINKEGNKEPHKITETQEEDQKFTVEIVSDDL